VYITYVVYIITITIIREREREFKGTDRGGETDGKKKTTPYHRNQRAHTTLRTPLACPCGGRKYRGNAGVAVGVVGVGVDGIRAMAAAVKVVLVVRQEANGPLRGEEERDGDAERVVLYRSTLFSTA